MEDWDRMGNDSATLAVKLAMALALLAEAAYEHPEDSWAKRARALVPNLSVRYTPPCPGSFNGPPRCDEMHAHGPKCGRPEAVCTRCGKTNAEHRKEHGLI